MAIKKGISLKLDPLLIKQLESIADREDRTLSNQISYFVKRGLAEYVSNNHLTWQGQHDAYFTEEEWERKNAIPF